MTDPEEVQEFTTDVARRVATHLDAQVAVCVWPGDWDGTPPATAILGNAAGMAGMLRRMSETALRVPRPTDCARCAAAWDRIQAAHLALLDMEEGPCV